MFLQLSPNRWSCLPTSFAMVLGVRIEQLFEEIGHDGSEVYFPELLEPERRRSFHIQEMIDCCDRRNVNVTPIEARPLIARAKQSRELFLNPDRISKKLFNHVGVLTGKTLNGGKNHAVAFINGLIYDPNGDSYTIDKFQLQTFWRLR